MKNKQRIIISVIFCVIGFISGIIFAEIKYHNDTIGNNEIKDILVEYGKTFPAEKLDTLKEKKEKDAKYKIFLYVDPYCDSCINKILTTDRMYEILQAENIGVNLIWRKNPKEVLNANLSISKENQYVTNNVNIINEYPLYFITDKNNKVLMITDDVTKVMKKIFEFSEVDKNEIIDASNQYLKSQIQDIADNKKYLIYFSMEGCPDCKRAEEILEENDIFSGYNSLTVFTEDSFGKEEVVDIGSLFLSIYDIDWYPSFLVIGDDGFELIRQESEENLINFLKNEME